MIETCGSIFKSFNINNLSVCIGWCTDQVTLPSWHYEGICWNACYVLMYICSCKQCICYNEISQHNIRVFTLLYIYYILLYIYMCVICTMYITWHIYYTIVPILGSSMWRVLACYFLGPLFTDWAPGWLDPKIGTIVL